MAKWPTCPALRMAARITPRPTTVPQTTASARTTLGGARFATSGRRCRSSEVAPGAMARCRDGRDGRDGAILQVSGCTGQDRARRQDSSPVELELGDRAADLAPITLLDSGCRVLVGVRCLLAIGPRGTRPRKVAKLSATAGILRDKCLIGTGPRRPSRGPEAYDPRTAEKITNRDTRSHFKGGIDCR